MLFLPTTLPEDPFGASFEYYLSSSNNTSLNGYNPFPTAEQINFVSEYGEKLNVGKMSEENLKLMLEKFGVRQIVVFKNTLIIPPCFLNQKVTI